MSMNIHIYMYIYICIYTCIYIYMPVYKYMLMGKYIHGAFNKLPDFFVQAFRNVVDS